MNKDTVEGNWKQLKGKVRQQWGRITDDQIDVIGGKRDMLAGRIQESYGVTRDDAERQVRDWESSLRDEDFETRPAPGADVSRRRN